jgi:transglycosylase-like protein with SLT domain
MRKKIIRMMGSAAMLLTIVSCEQAHVRQPLGPVAGGESPLDLEVRRALEKGTSLDERQRQIPAIVASFARRTEPARARMLAALCYLKTLGTPFTPLDLAEIALAETGGHGLSGEAISPKGALGVWQLMPFRAKSHGFTPAEMTDDEKCAQAAVRELASKLEMADGNLDRAKRLYCGTGRQATYYEKKIRQFRRELRAELERLNPMRAAHNLIGATGAS